MDPDHDQLVWMRNLVLEFQRTNTGPIYDTRMIPGFWIGVNCLDQGLDYQHVKSHVWTGFK